MKKMLMIAAAGLMIAGLSSCKKDYECCYADADGTKLDATSGFGCATSKMKKKDAEDLESKMNDTAKLWGGSASCEKK